jgi:peroxiredoxin
MRRLAAALAAVLLALCAGCATGDDAVDKNRYEFVAPGGQQIIFYDPPETRGALTGFSGASLLDPGRTVGLDDYAGQVVVINIWGAWCGVCRPEMRDLQAVQDGKGPGVAVLGVDIRDNAESARDFQRSVGVTYDSIFDPPGRVLFQLNGYPRNVVPSTIVLDRRHRVAAVYLTRVPVPGLVALIDRVKAESLG